jgi:phospho-N-acetylmuramoyl-pentapeptide-transferase
MYRVMAAMLISLFLCITLMPVLIRMLKNYGIGQFIREDGPSFHLSKEGTPTMGGALIIIALVVGFVTMSVTPSLGVGWALAFVAIGLGLLGFADDLLMLKHRRSRGLGGRNKILWQLLISLALAYLATHQFGIDTKIYFFKADNVLIDLGPFYYVLVFFMVVGESNAVNLTDGLDGLASGSFALVMAAYIMISFIQFRNHAFLYPHVRGSLDVAIFCGATMGGCIGFLWWNAPPAQIFMGDTGSLALGGILAAVAIFTKTELLLLVLGGLFLMETLSVSIQVLFYKLTKRRVFRMAPLHHHFELAGWSEFTVLVRFWLIAGTCVGLGFIIFYINYVGSI